MPSINCSKHPLHTNPQMIRSLYYKLELFMGRDIFIFTRYSNHIRTPLITLLILNLRLKGILSAELGSEEVVFVSKGPGLGLWVCLSRSKNYVYLKRSEILKSLVYRGIGVTSSDIILQLAFTEEVDCFYRFTHLPPHSYAIFDTVVLCSLALLLPLLTILWKIS